MIVFDLCCEAGHRFEGWFGSSGDFAEQTERGLVSCPICGSCEIAKAPMAPAVPRKGNQAPAPVTRGAEQQSMANAATSPELAQAMAQLAAMQREMLKQSRWVGDDFAEQSRAMHYGERAAEVIHGKASMAEAKRLAEEGVPVAPLPFPVAEPDQLN